MENASVNKNLSLKRRIIDLLYIQHFVINHDSHKNIKLKKSIRQKIQKHKIRRKNERIKISKNLNRYRSV